MRPGLPLREAESRWPQVTYRADDPEAYARAFVPVLDVLDRFSPTVEWGGAPITGAPGPPAASPWPIPTPYAAFLDGAGLEALYGPEDRLGARIVATVAEEAGHEARVGIADGRFAAWAAALGWPMPLDPATSRRHGAVRVVAPGLDAAFLAPLPAAILPLPPQARARLARLGVETVGRFAALPPNALRHRLGPDGVRAARRAAGLDDGPLRPRLRPLSIRDAVELDWAESNPDRLRFLLKRLADRLGARLGHHGLGCGRLRVTWTFEVGGGDGVATHVATLHLAEPTARGDGLLDHLGWHVEGLREAMVAALRDSHDGDGHLGGVLAVAVEAEEVAPLVGRQLALLPGEDGRAPDYERLLAAQRAVARLRARWGEDAALQAEPVASRRAEAAFRWRAPDLLGGSAAGPTQGRKGAKTATRADTAPHGDPVSADAPPSWLREGAEEVRVERGDERRGPALERGGRRRRIARTGGPWRLVEAWAEPPLARDGYHVATADGAAYVVIRDHDDGRWRVLGVFD